MLSGLLLLVIILVNFSPVQTYIARQATHFLSKKLQTTVSIKSIRIDLLNHLVLQQFYLEDRRGDTLLYAGELEVRITDWFFLRKQKPVVHYIGLHDAFGHLYRTKSSDEWNYKFLIDVFDTGKKDSTKKQNEFELDLQRLEVQRTRFHMDDAWRGSDFDIAVGKLVVDARSTDLKRRILALKTISVDDALIAIREYEGGKAPSATPKTKEIDTTAFNKGDWKISAGKIAVSNSRFTLISSKDHPPPDQFDPSHMDIHDIEIRINNASIIKDTVKGKITGLAATERCGIRIKRCRADVTVSPNKSVCNNLYLQTNRSTLQRYYSMEYQRFPDFKDYIHKVVMTGDIKNSIIDTRDIAYFAPVLDRYPAVLYVSGFVRGTVDNLDGRNLNISDGSTFLKGDLSMKGLPDFNNTFITLRNGNIFTTNGFAFKYFPELRHNNPGIAIDHIQYLHFQGNFAGYPLNFAANGTLSSNLGTIYSDVKLNLPENNTKAAIYSGVVSTQDFALGELLAQPLIGHISFEAKVRGVAFDPHNASVNVNGLVHYLDIKGYRYKNLIAEGTLAKKQFNGKLLVDDPNLAFAFYGNADFSGEEMSINATANLLKSDLMTLHLTQDSITATADFDLNFTGNDIDNFKGYAKLYNINITRDRHRLDVDSVYVNSGLVNGEKSLIIESNDVSAQIIGDYQLSTLPRSVQFYIAGYLPNYIIAPTRYAPDQNLKFSVTTRNIDSLFEVLLPAAKGFNNALLLGALNTAQQQLILKANIPYGAYGPVSITKTSIQAEGNLQTLSLTADVSKIAVGKDLLSATMKVKTEIGNDSMSFNIATQSPDAVGTLSVNGHAFASGDSLYLRLLPSEFYLNKNKWEIPSGNRFVFSKNYLLIRNLLLHSGPQEVRIATAEENTNQLLAVTVKDLDVGMLGGIAGISEFQPGGSINGSVNMRNLFDGIKIAGNLRGTEIAFGADTLGTVQLEGNYDGKKKIISLEPTSGIYRGNASLRAGGSMSFDSTNRQLLKGYVVFTQAPVNWLSPLVSGLLSEMKGTLDGTINIGGSALSPDVNGKVSVRDAGTKIDIIGTYYRIPTAELSVDNNSIDFGRVTIYDAANRTATLTGGIAHDRFRNIRFDRVTLTSPEFEVLNLKEFENNLFYGNLVASVEPMSVSGTFDDIRMNITASPVARSHIFIPVKTTADVGTYSYVSFESYGTTELRKPKNKKKFSLSIIGKMNPLAEMTLVLDPATGDVINAKGYGTIQLNVPSNEDLKMYGNYEIEEGDYTFTLQQLAFRRNFSINAGSRISFNGDLSATNLDINGVYSTKARLIDLLNEKERSFISGTPEEREAKASQKINVLLHMTGSLNEPKLTFALDAAETHTEGSLAYQKLKQINQNDRELFDQVASLLLVNSFIPLEGFGGSTATTGAINNISELISTTASSQLTNIVNRLLGDPNLSVELKYKNYNLSDPAIYGGGVNRNEVSFNVRKNLLDDRLMVELGSAYDWGRPVSSSSNTSNLTGDFRVQYLLTADGRVRATVFRTSNYDVLFDRDIWRGGIGISYRKTFDNLHELLHGQKPELHRQADTAIISETRQ